MKKLFVLIGALTLFMSCNQSNPEKDKSNVEATIKGFFSAVEKLDLASIPKYATSDFTGYENGYSYPNINAFVDVIKSFEGSTGKFTNLKFVNSEVMGNMAFAVIEFEGSFTKGPVKFNMKTYENYILKKVDNIWRIHYIHSSHLPDVNDKNLTSLHLIKLDENMPINRVEKSIAKLNSVVSSIGYADCGYKILTILPKPESKYNCLILANWKNQETYNVIHESDLFKKVAEETSGELTNIFKNEIYIKASLP